ncbi:crossover junction endodeoxyribonuclease RuvC [Paludicola sp. MB14-C6]|uniref:crossover junction endodeoxyribonuclease RuvC n=1 Tax=Paludihabitans sp. MB14-C6 TaxID=3070656 RepID=UPI0027DAB5E5|nr:crossover junction endodeoxyribonuclease RuvC [Paludicola sp. MB14-C6]WMJ23290.1 crossover junction endodeoxyribonuclease RuvC [Paludicola sp. MB14-C6]
MKIIGIDPGYAIVGFGVISYNNMSFTTLDYGAIITEANTPFNKRLLHIYNEFSELLKLHKPDAVSIEKLFFTNNQKTGIDVAQARGIILLACEQNNIPCYEYTPLQVKQAVVGYGKAEKAQVMDMTKRLLKLTKVPKPDDTADALAIAICHAHVAPSQLNKQLNERLLGNKW